MAMRSQIAEASTKAEMKSDKHRKSGKATEVSEKVAF